jgi:predicted dithiol-disulfide oxidoreductase (DUF899 family)
MPSDIQDRLRTKWEELQRVSRELDELLIEEGHLEAVEDYELTAPDGSRHRLSELFGGHRQMVLVHNMGFSCTYCTLWAEGFNGVWRHIESGEYTNKARFILISEDRPEDQQLGREQRGWTFDMYTARGTTLSKDLGFKIEHEGRDYLQPGASILQLNDDGTISRHARTHFGPGDLYCSVFHLFDLLPLKAVPEPRTADAAQ